MILKCDSINTHQSYCQKGMPVAIPKGLGLERPPRSLSKLFGGVDQRAGVKPQPNPAIKLLAQRAPRLRLDQV